MKSLQNQASVEATSCFLHQLAHALHNVGHETGNGEFAPMLLDQLDKKVEITETVPGHLGITEQARPMLRSMAEALRVNYESPETKFLAEPQPQKLHG